MICSPRRIVHSFESAAGSASASARFCAATLASCTANSSAALPTGRPVCARPRPSHRRQNRDATIRDLGDVRRELSNRARVLVRTPIAMRIGKSLEHAPSRGVLSVEITVASSTFATPLRLCSSVCPAKGLWYKATAYPKCSPSAMFATLRRLAVILLAQPPLAPRLPPRESPRTRTRLDHRIHGRSSESPRLQRTAQGQRQGSAGPQNRATHRCAGADHEHQHLRIGSAHVRGPHDIRTAACSATRI